MWKVEASRTTNKRGENKRDEESKRPALNANESDK